MEQLRYVPSKLNPAGQDSFGISEEDSAITHSLKTNFTFTRTTSLDNETSCCKTIHFFFYHNNLHTVTNDHNTS